MCQIVAGSGILGRDACYSWKFVFGVEKSLTPREVRLYDIRWSLVVLMDSGNVAGLVETKISRPYNVEVDGVCRTTDGDCVWRWVHIYSIDRRESFLAFLITLKKNIIFESGNSLRQDALANSAFSPIARD
jgi:hypothetical protein